ncbi:MAG TPA: cell wall-binding repeat-containing protein [Nitriliruptorales bacterium]|nr:cell wall-binding repeat-containing protein [Nitriliruptorales bacterium]
MAVAEPEWRSLVSGHGWGPCAQVVFTLNLSGLPEGVTQTALRSTFGESAAMVNNAAGRTVIRLAPGTTVNARNPGDGVNAVLFEDLNVDGRAMTTTAPDPGGGARITDVDVVLDGRRWSNASPARRREVLAHELGHGLGLHHVGDAHELMSEGFIDDGDGAGPGTTRALRTLYPGSDCARTPVLSDSHPWHLPPARPRASKATVGGSAGDVRALAVELGTRLGLAAGGGTGWATHAVVCRADLFADCLGGAALAGRSAPLVYVPGGPSGQLARTDATLQFLQSAVPLTAPVYVLGGPDAVSDAVMQALAARWPDTRRLAGPSRFETAAQVAQEVVARNGRRGRALLARGDNPADAVAAGAAAGRLGLPVLLTPSTELHPAAHASAVAQGATRVLVLGGPVAIDDAVVARLAALGRNPARVAGSSRSGTAVAIARHPELWHRTAVTGDQGFVGLNGWHPEMWALALAAAPLGARTEAPILLTRPDDVPYGAPTPVDPGGDTGFYLAQLTGTGPVSMLYVGAGRWADRHAQRSFHSYLGLR